MQFKRFTSIIGIAPANLEFDRVFLSPAGPGEPEWGQIQPKIGVYGQIRENLLKRIAGAPIDSIRRDTKRYLEVVYSAKTEKMEM